MGLGGQGTVSKSGSRATGGSAAAAAAEQAKREVLIDGRYYDVTDFAKRHPGGSVISYFDGADASEAFHEFHARSERARKWLERLPSRPATVAQDPLVRDFNALREQLVAEGFFAPSLSHVTYRSLELIAMHVAGIYMVLGGWVVSGLLVLGIAQGRCGWYMHEAGHYSLTGRSGLDRHIQMLAYGYVAAYTHSLSLAHARTHRRCSCSRTAWAAACLRRSGATSTTSTTPRRRS